MERSGPRRGLAVRSALWPGVGFLTLTLAGAVLLGALPRPGPTFAEPLASTTDVSATGSLTFSPSTVTVTVGSTVRWTSSGGCHTSKRSNSPETWSSGGCLSSAFERQFDQAGSFAYFCEYHGSQDGSGMAGTVVVQALPNRLYLPLVVKDYAGGW